MRTLGNHLAPGTRMNPVFEAERIKLLSEVEEWTQAKSKFKTIDRKVSSFIEDRDVSLGEVVLHPFSQSDL